MAVSAECAQVGVPGGPGRGVTRLGWETIENDYDIIEDEPGVIYPGPPPDTGTPLSGSASGGGGGGPGLDPVISGGGGGPEP